MASSITKGNLNKDEILDLKEIPFNFTADRNSMSKPASGTAFASKRFLVPIKVIWHSGESFLSFSATARLGMTWPPVPPAAMTIFMLEPLLMLLMLS